MMLDMIELYYFSPTGGTKKTGEIFCEAIARKVKTVNLGLYGKAAEEPEGEVVVVAVPVFGGRVPSVAAEKLAELEGCGKRAVTLAVYGNRDYEDALLELNRLMEERGFYVTATAALIAQHSITPEVGKGRPDEQDRNSILAFADKVLEKLEHGSKTLVKVPGNYPYKNKMNVPSAPVSLASCSRCGKCVSFCPTGAIRIEEDVVGTDIEKCILCMGCTAVCPEHARVLMPQLQERMDRKLEPFRTIRRENEYFL